LQCAAFGVISFWNIDLHANICIEYHYPTNVTSPARSNPNQHYHWTPACPSAWCLYRGIKGQREKGLGYEVEKKVLNRMSVNPRANMVGAEDGTIELPEAEEAAFEIMD